MSLLKGNAVKSQLLVISKEAASISIKNITIKNTSKKLVRTLINNKKKFNKHISILFKKDS